MAIRHWNTETLPNPETVTGAQAKADAARDAAIAAAASDATTKAGNAESAAKAYTDTHSALTNAHGATASATANRIIMRDSDGRAKVAAPSAETDIAIKATVTAAEAAAKAHADSKAADAEAAAKAYADSKATAAETAAKAYTDTHAGLTTAHSATSAATANRMVVRDSSGRARFKTPSHNEDAANKKYVDDAKAAAAEDATAKANQAEANAKAYADANFVGKTVATEKILLINGTKIYELSVDADGSLVTTLQS